MSVWILNLVQVYHLNFLGMDADSFPFFLSSYRYLLKISNKLFPPTGALSRESQGQRSSSRRPWLSVYAVIFNVLNVIDWARYLLHNVLVLVGYYMAVPVVNRFIERFLIVNWFCKILEKGQRSRILLYYRKHAHWTLVFLGPLIGIWVGPFIARSMGLSRRQIYVLLFIGAVCFVCLITGAAFLGLGNIKTIPVWLYRFIPAFK